MSKRVIIDELTPKALDSERLDRALCLLADITRKQAQEIIENSKVSLDGNVITKGSTKLKTGVRIFADIEILEQELSADAEIQIDIVFDDESIIVINKKPGQVVHPGSGNSDKTLVNGLISRYPEIKTVGDPSRPGIVHRLDKETSGLMVVARTKKAYENLRNQLDRRTVSRKYLALVQGKLKNKYGEIDAPLGRSLKDPRKRAVTAGGKWARTKFEVLETFESPETTLLDCSLDTGRTHQIRVHFASIGHPIYGDKKYGANTVKNFDRIFLHARELEFVHPESGEKMLFSVDEPDELKQILASTE